MRTIYVNMTKAELLRRLRTIPRLARESEAFKLRLRDALLERISRSFIAKSQGGTDETGDRWKPLAPSTIAKRLQKPGARPSGALSKDQRERWWDYYRRALWRFKDKAIAAKIAWFRLKREGVVPQYKKYGSARVDILRDTEALLLSLMPNTASPNKILRLGVGELILGTNRKAAAAHHKGVLGRLPRRRLWPDPKRWPISWWKPVLHEAREGAIDLVIECLMR